MVEDSVEAIVAACTVVAGRLVGLGLAVVLDDAEEERAERGDMKAAKDALYTKAVNLRSLHVLQDALAPSIGDVNGLRVLVLADTDGDNLGVVDLVAVLHRVSTRAELRRLRLFCSKELWSSLKVRSRADWSTLTARFFTLLSAPRSG